jgi:TonB family protein
LSQGLVLPGRRFVFFRRITSACAVAILALFMTTGLSSLPALSETPSAAGNDLARKIKTKVPPTYPELARRMNIRGTVRVLVVVSPNGNVKESRVVGGNPILVNSAVDALKKWKFEPAQEETTGVVEFRFDDAR